MKRDFKSLTRAEQRENLLRRLAKSRAEIEQYLRDLAHWNTILKAKGEEPLPRDDEMVRLLARVDQNIRQVRDSEKEKP